MAGAYSTSPCFVRPHALLSRKPLLLACAVITPRPRKLTKRKNYLRPKILKTLTKPYINPRTEPIISPLETPILHTHILPSDQVVGDELKLQENQELRLPGVSEPAGVVNDTAGTFYETPLQQTHIFSFDLAAGNELNTSGNQELRLSEVSGPAGVVNASAGVFTKSSLLKFGLWVVGAFVFQTVCAVWVLGSADYSGKNGTSDRNGYKNEVLDLDLEGKSKHKLRMFVNGDGKQNGENGGIVFVDETEMEKKIKEIRHMAREAREKERLKTKGSNVDKESEDEEDSDVKIGIKKEVDERLIKMRKRLEKGSDKQPANSVTYPRVDVDKNGRKDGVDLDEKELNAALIFKRKHKFRDFGSKPSNKPKGFVPPEHPSAGTIGEKTAEGSTEVLKNGNGEGGVDVSGDDEVDLFTLDSHRGAIMNFGESIERKENTEEAESETPVQMKKSSENNLRRKKGRSIKKVEGGKVDVVKSVKKNSLETRGRKKKRIASDLEECEPGIDISVDRNNGSSLFEAANSKKPIQETGTISNTGNTLVEVVDSKESHSMKSTTTMNRHKKSNRNGASKMEEVKDKKVVKPNGGYTHAERS
ncbi:DEAD-box ATP-dependent RNA helicase 42 isoform X2 [Nicotiana tomentosiformis]|uniref:DEAD-box ATP-dependent RNA helicase 42 isoform X2 n=1 Tax=Nicotiana tomentosiformis TaxID=4098 RepID=UPI00388CE984